jgi:hypothetical protein
MSSHAYRAAAAALLTAGSLVAISTANGNGGPTARHVSAALAPSARLASMPARMSLTRPPHTRVPQATGSTAKVSRLLLSAQGTVKPGEFEGAIGKCPKKFPTPVSGWFDAASTKVVLGGSRPFGAHRWGVGVENFDTVDSDYVVGIVCLK